MFIRGDVNGNGYINIADAYGVLLHLFGSPSMPLVCKDSADINNDGALDISDAMFLYSALMGLPSSSLPPAPFPDCGIDIGVGSLGCYSYAGCP